MPPRALPLAQSTQSAGSMIEALQKEERQALWEDSGILGLWSYLIVYFKLTSHKVLLSVLPLVLCTVLVRLAIQLATQGDFGGSSEGKGFQGIFSAETVTPFTTVSMFVIAMLLSGVLDDYKDSERIPAEIVCALDSLSEKICLVDALVAARMRELEEERKHEAAHAGGHGGHAAAAPESGLAASYYRRHLEEESRPIHFDSTDMHEELLRLTETILEYIACKRNYQDTMAVLTATCRWMGIKFRAAAEVSGVELEVVLEQFDEIRKSLARMSVIKRTNFIPSGQHLMTVLVIVTVFLVTLARYDNGAPEVPGGGEGRRRRLGDGGEESLDSLDAWVSANLSPYINIAVFNFLFIYILFLISDLEDPFEYSLLGLIPTASGGKALHGSEHQLNPHTKGAADIDMFPLLECYARIFSHTQQGHELVDRGAIRGVRGTYMAADGAVRPSELLQAEDEKHSTPEEVSIRQRYRVVLRKQLELSLQEVSDSFAGGSSPRKTQQSLSVVTVGGAGTRNTLNGDVRAPLLE